MVERINVGLVKPSDPLVFLENRPELALPQVSRPSSFQRNGSFELIVVEHRDLKSAAPTPE
jgi:hypothetical protein